LYRKKIEISAIWYGIAMMTVVISADVMALSPRPAPACACGCSR
jgi:hypothetical protein